MAAKREKFVLNVIQNKVYWDKETTLKKIKDQMLYAVKNYKPKILILPENFNNPLLGQNLPSSEYPEYRKDSKTIQMLSNFAKENDVYIIGGSIPIKDENDSSKISNTSFSFDNKGEIKAVYRKIHLFDCVIPNKVNVVESSVITPGGKEDLLTTFDTPFCKFGIGICYDIRFYEHAHLLKAKKNIDCLVYPSAFSVPTGELHWDLLRRIRALDNNVHLVMASSARNVEDKSIFQIYGHSSVVTPYGQVVKELNIEEGILSWEIDLSLNDDISRNIPTWKHKRSDLYEITQKI